MARQDNILAFSRNGGAVKLSDVAARAVADCRQVVARVLPKLMTGLFEKLDDALYELADKSESNQLQTAYFDAMRSIRRRRDHIHDGFIDGVLQDYDRVWIDGPRDLSPEQTSADADESGLSLVDDEELEQSLAVGNLVSKGENRYQRELHGLNRRFGMLIGELELENHSNPIGPAAICNRFHQTIRDLAVETPVLLVIYKLFDKQVMNYAGGLYEELSALLNQAGFVPKAVPTGRQAPAVPPQSNPGASAMPPMADQTPAGGGLPPVDGQPPTSGFGYSPTGSAPVPGAGVPGQAQPPYPGQDPRAGGYGPAPSGYGAPGVMPPGQQAPAGGAYPATQGYQPGYPGSGQAQPGQYPGYPGGDAHVPSQPFGAPPGQAAPTGEVGGYGAGDGGHVGFFHNLQDLLAGYRSSVGGSIQAAPAGLPMVATPELIGALSTLQRAFLMPGSPITGQSGQIDLRGQLTNALGLENEGKASRSLNKSDDDTIDVVSMLFEFLLNDPNLPDPMKVLISRLQIPMLKVALMDKAFFSRSLHPARRLLNNLARAALSWTDDGDRSEQSLYGRVESIVNRVVDGFEDDPSLFQELDDEFAAYMEKERRSAEIAEERTNQVTRGKEQLRVAKQRVAEEISQRLSAYPRVPLVARTLLEDAWKDVLLLAYLRQGTESDAWRNGLEIADRLLHSVEPRAGYAERQQLLRAIPELLQSLREGLSGISYDQHKMARMFKELQSCHIACLRGAQSGGVAAGLPETFYRSPGPVENETASAEDSLTEIAGDEDEAIRQAAAEDGGAIHHDRYTDQAENLTVGTWLELSEEDGKSARVKLSWKSDISDAYVFVNRKGVKVLEMTMAGIAKLLRTGGAEVLQQVNTPIMDKAMDAMIDMLKSANTASG